MVTTQTVCRRRPSFPSNYPVPMSGSDTPSPTAGPCPAQTLRSAHYPGAPSRKYFVCTLFGMIGIAVEVLQVNSLRHNNNHRQWTFTRDRNSEVVAGGRLVTSTQ